LILNDNATGLNNEKLSMPTQVSPPSWLAEAMMNINIHNVSTKIIESMDMPSQPSKLNIEIVNYFVDNGSMEDEPIQHEIPEEDNNGDQLVVPEVEIQGLGPEEHGTSNHRKLGAFLKLPVKRVKISSRHSTSDCLPLGRS